MAVELSDFWDVSRRVHVRNAYFPTLSQSEAAEAVRHTSSGAPQQAVFSCSSSGIEQTLAVLRHQAREVGDGRWGLCREL